MLGIVAILAIVTTGLSVMLYNISQQAIAQVEPTDRFFVRDLCSEENDDLTGINYTTGGELSYDTSNCPVISKVIHKWNELSNSDKNTVTNRLSQAGYSDVTSQVQSASR